MSVLRLCLFGDPHHRSADVVYSSYVTQAGAQTLTYMEDAYNSMVNRGFVPDLLGSVGDNNTATDFSEKTSLLTAVVNKLLEGPGTKFAVLGNHDFEFATPTEVRSAISSSFTYFQSGKLYGSFDYDNWHIVILDANYHGPQSVTNNWGTLHSHLSGAAGDGGGIPQGAIPDGSVGGTDNELGWLTTDLASTNKPTLVFCHQTLAEFDGTTYYTAPTTDIERYAVYNRAAVRTVLENSGKVKAVFEGHQHFFRHMNINGIPYIDLPSLVGISPYPTRTGDKGIWTEVLINDTTNTLELNVWENDTIDGIQNTITHVIPYGSTSEYETELFYNAGDLTSWTVDTDTVLGVPQDILLTNAPTSGLLTNGLLIQGGTTGNPGYAEHSFSTQAFNFNFEFVIAKEQTNRAIQFSLENDSSPGITIVFTSTGLINVNSTTTPYQANTAYTIRIASFMKNDEVMVYVNDALLTTFNSAVALSTLNKFKITVPIQANGTTLLESVTQTRLATQETLSGFISVGADFQYAVSQDDLSVTVSFTPGALNLTGLQYHLDHIIPITPGRVNLSGSLYSIGGTVITSIHMLPGSLRTQGQIYAVNTRSGALAGQARRYISVNWSGVRLPKKTAEKINRQKAETVKEKIVKIIEQDERKLDVLEDQIEVLEEKIEVAPTETKEQELKRKERKRRLLKLEIERLQLLKRILEDDEIILFILSEDF